jgi:plasmid stabilization system protein ParE
MGLKVFWTDTAKYQIEEIFDYYKHKASLSIAQKLVKQIANRTIKLE